jgi:hypothetical protein
MKEDFIIDNFAIASLVEKIAKKEDGKEKATNQQKKNPQKKNYKKVAEK